MLLVEEVSVPEQLHEQPVCLALLAALVRLLLPKALGFLHVLRTLVVFLECLIAEWRLRQHLVGHAWWRSRVVVTFTQGAAHGRSSMPCGRPYMM